ncbi:unnamed protein product [Rotaria socialis]|uniref:Large ribosomal subunit protein mL49 n=1 Tax=Rotaria socialis TaxID=392032 RepID=A0A820TSR9_9BILA|nr:unnamed protein product [Rotaria socialis]CAF3431945.1 unnamed protein product [Rotaria socialis]CAF4139353.1 unnamed protein product [Rotaria socialis]CAF4474289.1 unnamed protein product [Rotaria socialis]
MSLVLRNILRRCPSAIITQSSLRFWSSSGQFPSHPMGTEEYENQPRKSITALPDELTERGAQPKFISGYETTKDGWEWVDNVLFKSAIPEPPNHPTPSGWFPPNPTLARQWPYFVDRDRFHSYALYVRILPVMLEYWLHEQHRYYLNIFRRRVEYDIYAQRTRRFSLLELISGDIWALDNDLKHYLTKRIELSHDKSKELPVLSQVDEIRRHILVDGEYEEWIADFLKEKGF